MKHLVEIGCTGLLSLHEMIPEASRVQVIEPIPTHVAKIRELYKDVSYLTVHPYAMWKETCDLKMYSLGETSYAEGVTSPVVLNHGYLPQIEHEIVVPARTFDEFDDGTIDLIDIDVEGAEWFVLEKMVSRPRVIILETYWKNYINPYMAQISKWMADNRYAEIAQEGANTFYKRFGM